MYSQSHNKEKIGLVVREVPTRWASCAYINEGMSLTYAKAAEVRIFPLYSQNSLEIISQIIQSDVTTLIFLDHQVRPLEILRNQTLLDTINFRKIRIFFHVYGCYMDRLHEYHEIFSLLKGQDVHLVASSPKHKKLVEYTLTSPGQAVHLIPFPLMEPKVENEDEQTEIRKKLRLPLKGKMFLYTGRISTYKNVELAMKLLAQARKKDPDLFFVYVGSFDSYDPYSVNDKISNPSIINSKLLQSLDPDSAWCFHREFENEDTLKAYYLAADAFIALSVCKGEDFGMSILEASYFGLPCFLTDWGGYSGFSHLPQTYYASVILASDDILIQTEELEKKIQSFIRSDSKKRKEKKQQVYSSFGLEATTLKIQTMLASESKQSVEIKKEILIQRIFLRHSMCWDFFRALKDVYEFYAN